MISGLPPGIDLLTVICNILPELGNPHPDENIQVIFRQFPVGNLHVPFPPSGFISAGPSGFLPVQVKSVDPDLTVSFFIHIMGFRHLRRLRVG